MPWKGQIIKGFQRQPLFNAGGATTGRDSLRQFASENERHIPMNIVQGCPWRAEVSSYGLSWGGGESILPPVGEHGLLVVEAAALDRVDSSDLRRYSRLPTILVGETPVASGLGTLVVELPPGEHVVSVTVLGNRESSTSYPVTIRPGRETFLRYALPQDATWPTKTRLGFLGRPQRVSGASTELAGPILGFMFLAMCLASIPLTAIAAIVDGTEFEHIMEYAMAGGVAMMFGGALYGWYWARRGDAKRALRRIVDRRAASVSFRSDDTNVRSVSALGSVPTRHVAPAKDKAYLVIALRAHKRSVNVKGSHGSSEPWRAPASPPIVTVDGEPLPRGWGQWLLEVKPGSYSVRVDVPDHQGRPSHHSGRPVVADAFVTCQNGRIARVTATVDAEYEWNADGLSDYRSSVDLRHQ